MTSGVLAVVHLVLTQTGVAVEAVAPEQRVDQAPAGLCCRRTISVIQMGANGDVQFGGVG